MRPLTIDLDQLVVALNSDDDEYYLDLLSGCILMFAEDGSNSTLDTLLREEPQRLLPIDPLDASEGLARMQNFLPEVNNPQAYRALEQALAGRKPLRTFLHVLTVYPELQQAWHAFEHARLHECALDWLAEHQLQPH